MIFDDAGAIGVGGKAGDYLLGERADTRIERRQLQISGADSTD